MAKFPFQESDMDPKHEGMVARIRRKMGGEAYAKEIAEFIRPSDMRDAEEKYDPETESVAALLSLKLPTAHP